MTAKFDKKSNISTCLEMIKAAKVQNAQVSMLPSYNIICPCVKHNAICDHNSHESINFCEQLFCLLLVAWLPYH
jgi:predicted amidohydrolase